MPAFAGMTGATRKLMSVSNRKARCETRPEASIRHRHRTQREAFARRELFGRALELAAGRQDVAAARRAHRRSVTGIENDLRESLDLIPLRAFVPGARPRIEGDQVDLGRN